MSDFNEERLGKLVQLAKRGEGGEKATAIKFVKALCKRHGLNFDEVMSADESVREFYLDHTRAETKLAIQVICRYAHRSMKDGIHSSVGGTRLYFETTQEKYIETLNAWEVLRELYAKEKKIMQQAFFMGFLDKHWLYYMPTDEERRNHSRKVNKQKEEESEDEKRARRMGAEIADHLQDANIVKRIGAPKKS